MIRNVQKMTFRTLANITSYCANLGYVNNQLIDHLEREIVKRLKQTTEFKSLLEKSEDDDNYTLFQGAKSATEIGKKTIL